MRAKNAIEWFIAAGIVGGFFAAIPLTGYALAVGVLYGIILLIGGY